MTCIAAIVQGTQIWMGADSAAGHFSFGDGNRKVFKQTDGSAEWIIGGAGDGRMVGLVDHAFTFPAIEVLGTDPLGIVHFLTTRFADSLWECLSKHGAAEIKEGLRMMRGTLLLGTRGMLFEIASDFGVLSLPIILEPLVRAVPKRSAPYMQPASCMTQRRACTLRWRRPRCTTKMSCARS